MKKWILTVVMGSAIFVSSAAAQEPGRTFGLGMGLEPLSLIDEGSVVAAAAPSLYMPFMVTETVMLEPSLGLTRVSDEQTDGATTYSSSMSVWRLGLGVLLTRPFGPEGRGYFGPRIGLVRMSQSEESGTFDYSEDRLNLTLAGVTGAEFFLAEQFSLGGEVGLEYVHFGQPDVEPEPSVDIESDGSALRTVSELRLRWYFR